MKRVLWVVAALLLFGFTARAQETPQWELFGGYSHLRANLNGPGSSFSLNGGAASFTENLNSWFGGRFEFNAWGGTVSGASLSAQTFTYGPVISYRKHDRFTPYAEAQFGGIHASQGYLGVSESSTRFAMAAGGGFDYKIGRRAAVRVQGDYLMSRFLDLRQDNLRLSTGLVIYFGKK